MVVDVLDDVEDAELMASLRPDFGQQFGIKVRAVGDDDLRGKAVIFEISQEAAHVILIVGGNQSEGDGKIADRVGGQAAACDGRGAVRRCTSVPEKLSRVHWR